ncbi:DUF4142 domain-containing protein [Mucilaginibacter sp. RS28]|uniref:DUF4142 domain-containing protein n=1 Tax=Mucilaginibacter straminoryzae TaxID=2932774 RepID=A0A9X2B7Z6_9SPHI|nr:DUF4142 domain-containing protein [Mucilaginibacter straminoryzae]MCJ8208215.1 DUF4142 domain-containing protein [Mucilaginibacter straminoryzae]
MKKTFLMMTAAAGITIMAACNSQPKDSKEAADSINKASDTTSMSSSDTSKVGTPLEVSKDDAEFAVDAANGGMAEVEMGKLVAGKTTNPDVKKFAEMMITDHTKANTELIALAKQKNITLPSVVGTDEKKMMDDLAKKSGKEFDKDYVDMMVKDHEKDVSKFKDASEKCKDADLKAFATKTLPVLQGHLDAIKKIQASMK